MGLVSGHEVAGGGRTKPAKVAARERAAGERKRGGEERE